LQMLKVVITGASGFLGRHLAAGLAGPDVSVTRVSRRAAPGCCQVDDYRHAPDGDVLIHLAEEPDRAKVNQAGERYVAQAASLLEGLSSRGYQKLVYASSGVVYGDRSEQPYTVDMPVEASDVYSKSKLLNEQIAVGGGGVAVRLSNVVGEGMSLNNVLSDIMRQVPGTGALSVRDDQPVRDFVAASDVAGAFGRLAQSSFSGIVNVGSGVPTSVRELAAMVLSLAGQQERPIVATTPSDRRSINVLDISRTTQLLGWRPVRPLRDELNFLLGRQGR
jgi:UDP-glucose 4-epimerase